MKKRLLLSISLLLATIMSYSQGISNSVERVVGEYTSDEVDMPNLASGVKLYLVLELKSNKQFNLIYRCSLNDALVEFHDGTYEYADDGRQGAGALFERGQRIGTFVTEDDGGTVVGITLGKIYMKKKESRKPQKSTDFIKTNTNFI